MVFIVVFVFFWVYGGGVKSFDYIFVVLVLMVVFVIKFFDLNDVLLGFFNYVGGFVVVFFLFRSFEFF